MMPIRDICVPNGNDEAIREAFKADGYCVVTDVLSPDEVNTMLNEVWTNDNLLGKFDRRDPGTWADPSWPQQDGGRNFLESTIIFQDVISWDLQGNKNVLHLQQLLYERSNIMCSEMGRLGVMRPTRVHPEWQTESSWLHWDQNPNTQPGFLRVQCFVCLTDNTATSGGFACVPGFHERFRAWGENHPMGTLFTVNGRVIDETFGEGQPFPVPPNDPCQAEVVRVVAPAGSAVFWDSRLPHQNFPNTDDAAFWIVHYCMMKVKDDDSVRERVQLMTQTRILVELWGEEGPKFPHHLSEEMRFVHCLDETPQTLEDALQEIGVEDENGLREAAKLVREAGELEERGAMYAAMKKHQSSERLFPEIENWHNAIFLLQRKQSGKRVRLIS